MLKSAFGVVKGVNGSVRKRLVFVSAINSNARQIGTARTVFSKEDGDGVPGVLYWTIILLICSTIRYMYNITFHKVIRAKL